MISESEKNETEQKELENWLNQMGTCEWCKKSFTNRNLSLKECDCPNCDSGHKACHSCYYDHLH